MTLVERLPLTAAQTAVWRASRGARSTQFQVGQYHDIEGPLDLDVMDLAFRAVLSEVDAMRSRIDEDADGPYQVVARVPGRTLGHVDVSGEPDPLAAATAAMRTDLDDPDDPLWTSTVYRLGARRFCWYWRYHAMLLDTYGVELAAQRSAQIYNALVAGRPVPGEGRLGTLRELVDDDHAYRSSAQHARDREFWLARLTESAVAGDEVAGLGVAGLDVAGVATSSSGIEHTAVVGPDLGPALDVAAKRAGSTWSRMVIGAAVAFAHRRTGADPVTLGLVVSARTTAASRAVPGAVANVLPLRVPVGADPAVTGCAERVNGELRGILPYQRFRVDELLRSGYPYGPRIDVAPQLDDLDLGGARARRRTLRPGPFRDLRIGVSREDGGRSVRVRFDGDPGRYTAAALEAAHGEFVECLDDLTRVPPGIRR